MSATTTTVTVPPEKAEIIERISAGLESLGSVLAMSRDGVRDGIALRSVFKKHSFEAQEMCLAAGVLVAEGWLSMVVVQGRLKGFIRTYPKAAVPARKENVLQFPMRSCETKSAQVAPGTKANSNGSRTNLH